jgi:hypothetical protein
MTGDDRGNGEMNGRRNIESVILYIKTTTTITINNNKY